MVKSVFENVVELCKKRDEKYANLRVRNFVDRIVYDAKFIELDFRYPVNLGNDDRTEVPSAARRCSEANDESFTGGGQETAKPRTGKVDQFGIEHSANSGGETSNSEISNEQQHVSASGDSRAEFASTASRRSEAITEEKRNKNNIAKTISRVELENSETPNERGLREFKEAMGIGKEASVGLNISPNVGSNLDPNVSSKVDPDVSPNLDPNVSPNLDPNVSSNLDPNVSSNVGSNVSPNLDPNVSSNVGSNVSPNLDPNVSSNLDPNVSNDDVVVPYQDIKTYKEVSWAGTRKQAA